MKKQTTGQVHFGFNKCPSVGNVHFSPKPLDRGEMPVYHCTSAYTGEGQASHHPDSGRANCNKGGTLHRRGLGAPSSVAGELLSHLGLGQTVTHLETCLEQNVTLGGILP